MRFGKYLGACWAVLAYAQNVGIGTSNPIARLHVVGSAGEGRSVMIDNREIKFRGDGVAHFSIFGPNTGRPRLSISISSSSAYPGVEDQEIVSITDQGRVGIGQTDPGGRLTIRNGWLNWIQLEDAINGHQYYFHNPAAGDRLEIGLYDAGAGIFRWQVMGIRPIGNVGIGTALPHHRAQLEIASTTRGLLIPRMTTAQRDALCTTDCPQGLIIYNTDANCIEFFDTSADPPGGPTGGFWNSFCRYCDYTVTITTSQTGLNLRDYIISQGIPLGAYTYCVYVNAGVTLQAAGNGGGAGAAGNPGFNAFAMPNGAKVILYNYGTILAGGGNGGRGGRESDGVCEGDEDGQAGGRGGDAVLTNSNVPIFVYNFGTLRAGGGGGGGGRGSCCNAGGGGGGGAGTPPGAGGPGNSYRCVGGTVCLCGNGGRAGTSSGGSGGTAFTGGSGGAATPCSPGTGCPGTSNGCGGRGGDGGVPGAAGFPGGAPGGCCGSGCTAGAGGGPGYAINGNGSGSRLMVNTGTVAGAVIP
jgi:hypothetical protein